MKIKGPDVSSDLEEKSAYSSESGVYLITDKDKVLFKKKKY